MKSTKSTCVKAGITVAFLSFYTSASAQPLSTQGAESMGLGSTRLGVQNVWSSSNNPTDMHSDSFLQFGLSIAHPYGINRLKSANVSLVLNSNHSAYGGYISYLGYSVSHFTEYGLSTSKELKELLILGVGINGITSAVLGQQSRSKLGFYISLKYGVNPQTAVYFLVQNPTIVRTNELMLSSYHSGLSLQINPFVQWVNEVRVIPKHQTSYHSGIRYSLKKQFALLVGISTSPSTLSFGFSIRKQNAVFSSSFSHHPTLGFTPTISGQWLK
ncbi:MAG: hypothetical protein ACI8SE_000684 [Bacteroidia bacterium]|jgi:hypothetical protein